MKRLLIDRIILILILVIIAAACDSIKNSRPQPTAATTTAVPPTATAMLSPTAEPTPTPIPIEAAFDQSIDPANFPPHAAIVIHFNQPMDVDSTDSPLSISPFRQNSFEWQNNNTTLIVTLGNGLIAQKEYEISLDNELKGQNGQPLAESFSWQLQTTFPPPGHKPFPNGKGSHPLAAGH